MGRTDAASGPRVLPGWEYGFGPVERPSRRTSSPVRLEFASLIVPDAHCSVNRCRAAGGVPLSFSLNSTVQGDCGDNGRLLRPDEGYNVRLTRLFTGFLKFK